MLVATFNQVAYRFRADDGNETGATWLANENTGLTDVDLDVTEAIRLRIGIQETAGGSNNNINFTLQYRINGGSYQNVNGSTTAVIYRTSSHVTNGAVTTNQLSTPTGTFREGAFVSESESLARITFSGNDHGENEYSLQLVADDLNDGDTIDFRLLGNGSVLNNYTVTPTLTVTFEGAPSGPLTIDDAALLKYNRTGPFLVGTDLYTILVDDDTKTRVAAFKSEDGSTWDNVDEVELSSACVALSAVVDGSVIHVAHQETSGPDRVGYSRFDTSTDEWVVSNTQVTASLFDPITSGHAAAIIDVDQNNGANLVIGVARVHSLGNGAQIFSSTNTGAGWTGREEYSEVRPGAIVIGDDQTTHFILPNAFGQIHSQTWNSLGAGGNSGYVPIDEDAATGLRHMGQQMKFVDNGVFGAVPYVGDDNKAKIVWWESIHASPPDPPTYNFVGAVSTNDVKVVSGTPQAAVLRNSSGDWFLVYVDTSGEIRWVPGSFNTWGEDQSSGITGVDHLSAQLVDDEIVGVLVGDGTAGVTYEEFSTAEVEVEIFRSNTFAGGTDGVEITAANSGGDSGDAFDQVSLGPGGERPRYSDEQSISGGLSAKTVRASRQSDIRWNLPNVTEVYSRLYFRFHTMSGVTNEEVYVVQAGNFPDFFDWWIFLKDVGGDIHLAATDASDISNGVSLDTVLPENQWFRIETRVAQAGTYEVRLFLDPHSTTPTETLTGSTPETAVNGLVRAFASNLSHSNVDSVAYTDDFAISLDGWIGPSDVGEIVPSGSGVVSTVGSIEGSGHSPTVLVAQGSGEISGNGDLSGTGLSVTVDTYTTGSAMAQAIISPPDVPAGSGSIIDTGLIEGSGHASAQGSGEIVTVGILDGTGLSPSVPGSGGSGQIVAQGSVEGSGATERSGHGEIPGEASLEAQGASTRSGHGDVTAVGQITGQGQSADGGGGTIAATAEVLAAGSTERTGSGSVSTEGIVEGRGETHRSGDGSVVAEATLTGSGQAPTVGAAAGSGTVQGVGDIDGAGFTTPVGSGEVVSVGAPEGTGFVDRSGSGEITGISVVAGDGVAIRAGASEIEGILVAHVVGREPAIATVFLKPFITFIPPEHITTAVPEIGIDTNIPSANLATDIPSLDIQTNIPILSVLTTIPSLDIVTTLEE